MSLTHQYKFENNVVDTLGTLNGSAANITYSSQRIQGNYTASFNGSTSLVTLDNNGIMFGSGDFTIAFWIKSTDANSNRAWLSNYDNRYSGVYLMFRSLSNLAQFQFQDSAGRDVAISSTTVVNSGKWIHICGTRSGATGYLYINGKQEGTDTHASLGSCDSTKDYLIGGFQYWTGAVYDNYCWAGIMDDMRLYVGECLSAAGVRTLYNSYFDKPNFHMGDNL